jgi:hypothetical protein
LAALVEDVEVLLLSRVPALRLLLVAASAATSAARTSARVDPRALFLGLAFILLVLLRHSEWTMLEVQEGMTCARI